MPTPNEESTKCGVRAFPDNGTKVQVSNAGGSMPVWSRMGHELFYRTQDRRNMVARYAVEGGIFKAEKPRLWPGKQIANTGQVVSFDLAPDGKGFTVLMPVGSRNRVKRRATCYGR